MNSARIVIIALVGRETSACRRCGAPPKSALLKRWVSLISPFNFSYSPPASSSSTATSSATLTDAPAGSSSAYGTTISTRAQASPCCRSDGSVLRASAAPWCLRGSVRAHSCQEFLGPGYSQTATGSAAPAKPTARAAATTPPATAPTPAPAA
jgi:hypothetical protein